MVRRQRLVTMGTGIGIAIGAHRFEPVLEELVELLLGVRMFGIEPRLNALEQDLTISGSSGESRHPTAQAEINETGSEFFQSNHGADHKSPVETLEIEAHFSPSCVQSGHRGQARTRPVNSQS